MTTCTMITIANTMEIIKTQKGGEALIWQGSKFIVLKEAGYPISIDRSRDDIEIEGQWQKTLSREQFLLRQEGDVYIFATTVSLHVHLLAAAEAIFVDGTFEICPWLFYQFFTINAFVHS